MNGPAFLVLGPGAARDIPADDAFEREHGAFPNHHRAAGEALFLVCAEAGLGGESQADDVVLELGEVGR